MGVNNYSGLDLNFILTPSMLISAVALAATDDISGGHPLILTRVAISHSMGALKASTVKWNENLISLQLAR